MTKTKELAERLSDKEALRRFGQALWMSTDRPASSASLMWARGLIGDGGELLVIDALNEHGAQLPSAMVLSCVPVCRLLAALSLGLSDAGLTPGHVVWTMPSGGKGSTADLQDSYVTVANQLVSSAQKTLLLVSPYLERKGVGLLTTALLLAIQRGVHARVLTHGASDIQSPAALAVEELRRESTGMPGTLTVHSSVDDRVLLHPKIIVVDGAAALIGSANLTGAGLTRNFEAGVVLGPIEAAEIEQVVQSVLDSDIVSLSFSTSPQH